MIKLGCSDFSTNEESGLEVCNMHIGFILKRENSKQKNFSEVYVEFLYVEKCKSVADLRAGQPKKIFFDTDSTYPSLCTINLLGKIVNSMHSKVVKKL